MHAVCYCALYCFVLLCVMILGDYMQWPICETVIRTAESKKEENVKDKAERKKKEHSVGGNETRKKEITAQPSLILSLPLCPNIRIKLQDDNYYRK